MNGESGDVQGKTVDSWKERLLKDMKRTTSQIWTRQEYLEGPSQPWLWAKGKECEGHKRPSKEHFVTAAGMKEKPVIIW